MGHQLSELTSGLASRVNNLAVLETGDPSRQLLEQQDILAKLAMAAIVKDLSDEDTDYKNAVNGLNKAIKYIGDANEKIGDIEKAINFTSKAINLVQKALGLLDK
jgi:hypothetical protein